MHRSNSSGFTLVELMVALAVVGILLGVGVPSFINLLNRMELNTASGDLVATLQNARELAVTQGENVSLEQVDSSWKKVTCDLDGIDCGTFEISPGELDVQSFKQADDSANNAIIQFAADGTVAEPLYFTVESSELDYSYKISILKSGRISLLKVDA